MRTKVQINKEEMRKVTERRKSKNQNYEPLTIRSRIAGVGQTVEVAKTERPNK